MWLAILLQIICIKIELYAEKRILRIYYTVRNQNMCPNKTWVLANDWDTFSKYSAKYLTLVIKIQRTDFSIDSCDLRKNAQAKNVYTETKLDLPQRGLREIAVLEPQIWWVQNSSASTNHFFKQCEHCLFLVPSFSTSSFNHYTESSKMKIDQYNIIFDRTLHTVQYSK